VSDNTMIGMISSSLREARRFGAWTFASLSSPQQGASYEQVLAMAKEVLPHL
jgi:hypothetical protein